MSSIPCVVCRNRYNNNECGTQLAQNLYSLSQIIYESVFVPFWHLLLQTVSYSIVTRIAVCSTFSSKGIYDVMTVIFLPPHEDRTWIQCATAIVGGFVVNDSSEHPAKCNSCNFCKTVGLSLTVWNEKSHIFKACPHGKWIKETKNTW